MKCLPAVVDLSLKVGTFVPIIELPHVQVKRLPLASCLASCVSLRLFSHLIATFSKTKYFLVARQTFPTF